MQINRPKIFAVGPLNVYLVELLYYFLQKGSPYTSDRRWEIWNVQRLHQLGARKVIFHGLGPLGCAPSQRVKSKNGECLKRVNEWVTQFNTRVRKLLVSLNSELPDAGLAYADIYTPVFDLIQKPRAYGVHFNHSHWTQEIFSTA